MAINKILEAAGAATGILGTLWLSLFSHHLLLTFVLYGLSNACWIAFALRQKFRWLLVMNGAYAVCTVIGLAHLVAF